MKVFLRYRQQKSLGLISTGLVSVEGNDCISSALSDILEWNLKLGTSKVVLTGKSMVTGIAKHPLFLAVGYADGSIRLFGTSDIVLNGHRAPVTSLCFDKKGTRLASGSSDTDIVLWDTVSEQGLLRFKGHRDQVTALAFLEEEVEDVKLNHLISTSKDSLVKIWDIDANCCVENIVTHRGEVWALTLSGLTMFTGSADGQLRIWDINASTLSSKLKSVVEESEKPEIEKAVEMVGTLERQSKERILNIKVDSKRRIIGVQGSDKTVEIFKIKNESEIKKSISRRKKRAEKKGSETDTNATILDKYGPIKLIRASGKVRSFDFGHLSGDQIKVVVGTANNTIEQFEIEVESKDEPPRQVSIIEQPGHRSDVRCLALSDDDQLLISGSSDRLKLWSVLSGSCLSTFESGYALCCTFLPGNKHVIVGTKSGELQLFELGSSSMIESTQAHEGPIWSLAMLPDKTGIVTGSQDKQVKFWKFTMTLDSEYSKFNKRASLAHTRTLKLSDDVLCVRVSPDGKLLAISLLDLTVKIFYIDTLKFFLSLYGHKLPVISMDISSDSRTIITASSDKTVKIWGLDFGDCHKSILAHQDSVMQCQFVWGSYHFFTVSKDKTIKFWDAEKFEEITTLEGHHGEIWALAVGKYGKIFVTGSHDKSIRIWEETDEQFVLSEERETRLEKLYEAMDLRDGKEIDAIGSKVEGNEEEYESAMEPATKSTTESMKAGELLSEAILAWHQEKQDFDKFEQLKSSRPDLKPPTRNPFVIGQNFGSLSPEHVVLHIAQQIRASHLNDALLTLPFSQVILLLECVSIWIDKALSPVLASRVLFFLLRAHHNEIVSNRSLKTCLERIRNQNRINLKATRDTIGFNLYGLQHVLRLKEAQNVFLEDVDRSENEKVNIKRKIQVVS